MKTGAAVATGSTEGGPAVTSPMYTPGTRYVILLDPKLDTRRVSRRVAAAAAAADTDITARDVKNRRWQREWRVGVSGPVHGLGSSVKRPQITVTRGRGDLE